MSTPVAPPPPAADLPPQPPQKKKSGLKIALFVLLGVVGLAVAGVVAVVVLGMLGGRDATAEAKVGDCVTAEGIAAAGATTETEAQVVECGSADAKFEVVGRVAGESSPDSKSCDQFFGDEGDFFVYGVESPNGNYLLCLKGK